MCQDSNSIYQGYKKAFFGRSLPLAYVDLNFLDQNITDLKKRAGNLKIRLATKSVRCKWLLRKMLTEHADLFEGLMCFHPQEALWLSQEGFDNILVAYPYHNKESYQGLAEEIKKGKDIVFMADRAEHLLALEELAVENDVSVAICLDIDLSVRFPGIYFGVYRSGLKSLKDVELILSEFKKTSRLRLKAVMGYEAQIAGVGDSNPFQRILNLPVKILKKLSFKKVVQRRSSAVDLIKNSGHDLAYVNGGGTGSLHLTRQDPSVTELAAGSGLYAPLLFDYYSDFKLLPACGFALEVSRQPAPGIVTCAGGGYVASGASSKDKLPKPYLPEGLALVENEGVGEVQTPLRGDVGHLKIGDPVIFRHSKAGELCERFQKVLFIKDGKVEFEAETYRGEGKCFL